MPARGDPWSVTLVLLSTLALSGCAGASSPSGSVAASAAPGSSSPTASTASSQPPNSAPSAFPAKVPSGAAGRTWGDPTVLTSASRYGAIQAVAASPDRWVAVGGAQDWELDASGGEHFLWDRARVWTSTDGVGWAPVPHGPVFDGASIFGVGWTPRGFIAVGTWKDQRPNPDGQPGSTQIFGYGPAAWLSTDGLTWTVLEVDQERGTGVDQGRINAVVDFDGRIVAIGCLDESCLFGPAAWILEGDRFRRATGVPSEGPAGAYDVVRSPAGLVAVGTLNSSGDQPSRAAAWVSPDGEVWTRVDEIEGRDGGVMFAVSRAGDLLIAVGYASPPEGPLRPAAWISGDSGVSWQEAGRDDFADVTGMQLRDVVFTGQAIVAVAWIEEEPWRAAVWVSADGSRWERVDLPGTGAPAVSIADGPGGLVAVGGFVNRTISAWWSPAGATAP